LAFVVLVSGCSSSAERAQRDAYRAQEEVAKQRLELVDEYQSCVKKAGNDRTQVEACDSYLRAAESLK
jgi:hypothetical protein